MWLHSSLHSQLWQSTEVALAPHEQRSRCGIIRTMPNWTALHFVCMWQGSLLIFAKGPHEAGQMWMQRATADSSPLGMQGHTEDHQAVDHEAD
jgi:hypothetical protein